MDAAQWVALKARLMQIIDPAQDSLRFYYLGQHWRSKVEHIGAKPVLDLDAPSSSEPPREPQVTAACP